MSNLINPKTEALKVKLWEKLDTLPQRDVIERSDATQWIDYMSNIMPDEAMWHMIRAGGVGGSEIGGLARNYLGHRADHDFSAHDWALGKLLRKVPTPAAGVLQRGHDMEPLHAKRFYKEFNTSRDLDAYNTLSKASGSHIWMRYSPDDVVFFKEPTVLLLADGPIELQGRVLLDYKCPSEVDQDSNISFQYSMQLHQGIILCEEKGIELTCAALSEYDLKAWKLKNSFVNINREMCDLVIEVGDHYWDRLMRAEVPDYIHRRRFELDPQAQDDWMDGAVRLAQYNAMCSKLKNASETLKAQLSEGLNLNGTRLDGQSIVFKDALSINGTSSIDEDKVRQALGEDAMSAIMVRETTTKYDTDAVLARMRAIGEDLKPYRKIKKMDPSLTFDALVAKGLDPEEFITETCRVNVSKAMKEQAADWFDESFPALTFPSVVDSSMEIVPGAAAEQGQVRVPQREVAR